VTKVPTVADLLKLPGAKQAEIKQTIILTMGPAVLLHEIIMAHPAGKEVPAINADLQPLSDLKFIRQDVHGRWHPTYEGVAHMRPDLAREQESALRKILH
jgi:hypothetical protein